MVWAYWTGPAGDETIRNETIYGLRTWGGPEGMTP
jgi:hypothetical protein